MCDFEEYGKMKKKYTEVDMWIAMLEGMFLETAILLIILTIVK